VPKLPLRIRRWVSSGGCCVDRVESCTTLGCLREKKSVIDRMKVDPGVLPVATADVAPCESVVARLVKLPIEDSVLILAIVGSASLGSVFAP